LTSAILAFAVWRSRRLRDNQGEEAYCLTGECYPASDRCLIEDAPVA
jgi:hypothetical protein